MSAIRRRRSRRWLDVLLALMLLCASVTPAIACDDTAMHGALAAPAEAPSPPCHDDEPNENGQDELAAEPPCAQCPHGCLAQSAPAIPHKFRLTVTPTDRALPALPVARYGAAVYEPPYRPPAHVSSI